ncbi:MAG: copper-binding protein, partial [Nitrospiraceae bacterium]
EIHEKMGMEGQLIVGKGGEPKEEHVATVGHLFEGVGEVIHADQRKSQIVVDHKDIPGFMAAMIMGYPVNPVALLRGLEAGDRIRFTIDAEKQAIVKITPLTFRGEGTVISADLRKGQIIVDHKEIPGFMAAMIMGYPVKPSKLLRGLTPGQQIRFTIDVEQKAIVEIVQKEK